MVQPGAELEPEPELDLEPEPDPDSEPLLDLDDLDTPAYLRHGRM